jgi:hypothetical protein
VTGRRRTRKGGFRRANLRVRQWDNWFGRLHLGKSRFRGLQARRARSDAPYQRRPRALEIGCRFHIPRGITAQRPGRPRPGHWRSTPIFGALEAPGLASSVWENPVRAGCKRGAHGVTRPTDRALAIAAGGPVEAVVASITGRVWHNRQEGVSSTRRVIADLCSTRRVLGHFLLVAEGGGGNLKAEIRTGQKAVIAAKNGFCIVCK